MEIWVNPACSKCRAATSALDEAGVDYTVRRYLEDPPTREELDAVLARLPRPERVLFFAIEPNPAASANLRARVAAGEPLDGLVPAAVARIIEDRGLYRA